MTGVKIAAGSGADVPAIVCVMDSAFDPRFGERWSGSQCTALLSMPGSWLLVARASSAVAGFALCRTAADETELMLLAVEEPMQKRGIATALIKHVEAAAVERGSRAIFLEVREANQARRFYENVGFIQCGLRRNYYRGLDGTVSDAITYRKLLSEA